MKKDNERAILDRCIAEGLKKQYLCKRLISVIQGEDFEREENERPDFVKVYYPTNKYEKPVLIGIEHFMIDHQAKKKGKSFISPTKEVQSKIKDIYNEYGPRIQNGEDCIEEAFKAISDQVVRSTNAMLGSSYESFLNHFKDVLNKHAKSFNDYKRNLDKLAGEKYDTKLALLIEVQSDFRNFVVFDGKELSYSKDHVVPLFQDIIDLIKTVCLKDIDYIFMCFLFQGNNDRFEVAAVRPKSIENDLNKQGYDIYYYVNTDSDTKASMSSKGFTQDDDQFLLKVENTISTESPEVLLRNVFNDAFKVMELKRAGKSYITTEIVQSVVDEIESHIIQ